MIAAELYTLRACLGDVDDIAASLKRVREIGYDGVELAGLAPIEPARLRELLDGQRLVACSAHVRWERLRDETDAAIADCQAWGCDHVAIPFAPPEYRSAEGYARLGAEASEVGRRLHQAGIGLSYHNHAFELERFGAESGLDILYRSGDGRLLGAQLDTYWVQYGGASPAGWIRRMAERQPTIHVKDMAVAAGDPVMAEIGEGNLDWTDLLEACRDAGVRCLIVEQDECRRDPFESLAISRRNLAALGAG